MTHYRKKPVVIEARQWDGSAAGASPIIDWILGLDGTATFDDVPGPHLIIRTLEGGIIASPEDWIIRGVQGEFYPCKPGIFEATYEQVDA